jgi:hypothetical protein
MTGTIAEMAMASATTVTAPLRIVSWKFEFENAKRGAWRLPFLPICCVASEAR